MNAVTLNDGVRMPILGFGEIMTHPSHQQIETQNFLQENGVRIARYW
jgi:hypothetical protein